MRRLAVLFGLLATPALAQSVERLHGTIIAAQPDRMQVQSEDGPVTIMLPQDVRIGAVANRTLASIKPGDFVGSAAIQGRDGLLHAQEVHIFPESMRGTGEGHRPMDEPEQTMTNAAVDGIAQAAGGPVLHLRYAGGQQDIEVGPDVRVVELIPGDRSMLVPGAEVTVRASKGADGVLTAVSVQAEKDGVKPLP